MTLAAPSRTSHMSYMWLQPTDVRSVSQVFFADARASGRLAERPQRREGGRFLGIVIVAWYLGSHDPDRRGREPKRRSRQDHDRDQPRGVGGVARLPGAARRLR